MNVLSHGRQPVDPAAPGRQEGVQFLENVSPVGVGPGLGGKAVDVHHVQAHGQSHLGALLAQVNAYHSAAGVVGHFLGAETRGGGYGVAHAILAQLGPALPPQVVGGVGAVDAVQQRGDPCRPGRKALVVFAHAEHVMTVVAAHGAAPRDVPRLPQRHLDVGGDAAHGAILAHYAGDGDVVPAVLQRHEEAVVFHVAPDEVGGPLGIVGLDGDENEVERLGDALGVGQVHSFDARLAGGGRRHREGPLAAGDAEAVGPHLLHVLRPHINERDVLALAGKERANVAAQRTRAHDANLVGHAVSSAAVSSACCRPPFPPRRPAFPRDYATYRRRSGTGKAQRASSHPASVASRALSM